MAILNREQFLTRISELFPGDDDGSLSALEDLRDSYEAAAGGDQSAEIARLTEENESLRRRYRERFDSPQPDPDPGLPSEPEPEKTTFEQLFTERKEE